MTLDEALKILVKYQRWRRGADMPQPSPYIVGEALDEAIKFITKSIEK